MQPEGDFDQVRRQVFEATRRLLGSRRPEQPPVTTSEIAEDVGLEMPLVIRALQSLAGDHLSVKSGSDWQIAEVHGVTAEW